MLLGREAERQTIRLLLDGARAGRSGVLALRGEAGVGKSALLDWTATHAEGMRVLRARGVQSEAQIPFAALFELLRPTLGSLGRIPVPQAAALEGALALRPARAEERFAVGAATLSLLAAHAEAEPLAILIDDAHWLDGSSADAVLFAARRLVADPIAVVLTAREGETSLLDGADLPVVRLEGLDATVSAELLRREAPETDPSTAVRLYRETGGNPLALLELSRRPLPRSELDAPLPVVTSVAESYLQRLRSLPPATRDALVLAAATDRGDLALFSRAGREVGVTPSDLAPAEQSGLVELREQQIEFRHPLARSAVYAGADVARRRGVHRALANALPDADADRRAWHLSLAVVGPDAAAASALEQAAHRARARSAYGVAASAYEQSARLAPDDERRGRLLAAAADSAWLAGLPERTLALVDEADRFAAGSPLQHELDHLRGHVALLRGPLRAARAALAEAAERAASTNRPLAVLMLADAALGAFHGADASGMRDCGERAVELVDETSDARTSFLARIALGMGLVLSGDGERGAASIREAQAVLDQSEDLATDPRLLVWAAVGPLWLREVNEDAELVDRAAATARAAAAVGVLPHLLTYVAISQAASDRWVEAQAGFDEAIRLARETGQSVVLAAALARLALLEARLGREEPCRRHAGEALAIAHELDAVLCEVWALAALGDLELGLGNVGEALARLAEQQAAITRHGIADVDLFPAPEQVELHLRSGRVTDAEAPAAAYIEAAAGKGQPWALARAARLVALLAPDDEIDDRFAASLALHDRTPDVFERARTTLAYGTRLRRAGRRREARVPLRAALSTFEDLGAAPWAELARAELAATGETARRRDPSTLDELTPQELQVALVLAEGKTTKEAAAALFLSPKTIEYHLRNVYRKLAIHSRDELRRALPQARSRTGGPGPIV